MMAPTDILAKQHYETALKLFKNLNIKIGYLSGKLLPKEKTTKKAFKWRNRYSYKNTFPFL